MKKHKVCKLSQLRFARAPIARETLAKVRGGDAEIEPCWLPPVTNIRTIVPCVMPGGQQELRVIVMALLGK